MSEEIKGKCYQEHEPTPDKPCEIKTILCNDIEIPVEYLKQTNVIVDGKKYIELQQKNQKYKEVIDKAMKHIQKMFETGFYNGDYYLGHLNQILQDKEVE